MRTLIYGHNVYEHYWERIIMNANFLVKIIKKYETFKRIIRLI